MWCQGPFLSRVSFFRVLLLCHTGMTLLSLWEPHVVPGTEQAAREIMAPAEQWAIPVPSPWMRRLNRGEVTQVFKSADACPATSPAGCRTMAEFCLRGLWLLLFIDHTDSLQGYQHSKAELSGGTNVTGQRRFGFRQTRMCTESA